MNYLKLIINFRDLEPRKGGGNLRVTFSEVHIVAHNKEEDEGEDHESQDQTDHSHSQGTFDSYVLLGFEL